MITAVPATEEANGGALLPAPADATGPTGFSFTVPGIPTPWARTGGGKTVARFTPAKQGNAAGAIKLLCSAAMRGARPFEGPVRLTVTAAYPWPKSWSARKRAAQGWKTSRPDVDNLVKLIADSLNGVAWLDDAQIAEEHICKIYDFRPGLLVKVEMLT